MLIPFVLIATGTAIVAQILPNRYRAETLILVVPQRVPESYVRSTVTARIEERLPSISQHILSRSRLERVIRDFNLYPLRLREGTMEEVVDAMRRDIDVKIERGDAFRVSYMSDDPLLAKKVTERLASLFIEENLRDREVLAEGTTEFLETQLDEAKLQLLQHEKKLEAFRRQYGTELQVEASLRVVQNAQAEIQSLTGSMQRDADRRLMLERVIADASIESSAPGAVSLDPSFHRRPCRRSSSSRRHARGCRHSRCASRVSTPTLSTRNVSLESSSSRLQPRPSGPQRSDPAHDRRPWPRHRGRIAWPSCVTTFRLSSATLPGRKWKSNGYERSSRSTNVESRPLRRGNQN